MPEVTWQEKNDRYQYAENFWANQNLELGVLLEICRKHFLEIGREWEAAKAADPERFKFTEPYLDRLVVSWEGAPAYSVMMLDDTVSAVPFQQIVKEEESK